MCPWYCRFLENSRDQKFQIDQRIFCFNGFQPGVRPLISANLNLLARYLDIIITANIFGLHDIKIERSELKGRNLYTTRGRGQGAINCWTTGCTTRMSTGFMAPSCWMMLLMHVVSAVHTGNGLEATKSSSRLGRKFYDDSLVRDFKDKEMGIAFSMIPHLSWMYPRRGREIYHDDPSKKCSHVTSVSITNQYMQIFPYPGFTNYGLAFSLQESSGFYKYFATREKFEKPCPASGAYFTVTDTPSKYDLACNNTEIDGKLRFCASCADSTDCSIGPNKFFRAIGDQVPYSAFQMTKNAIVARSGKSATCPITKGENIWNEFNTNGVATKAVVGILVDKTHLRSKAKVKDLSRLFWKADPIYTPEFPDDWTPSDRQMCTYLQFNVNASRSRWPVYELSFTDSETTPSKLVKNRTLECP